MIHFLISDYLICTQFDNIFLNQSQLVSARGADLNAYNSEGFTPLHDAVKRGEAGIVEELLNYGANIDLQITQG